MLEPAPGDLFSVGPFDCDDENLSVRHMNLGFGWESDASLVLVLRRVSDQWASPSLPRWDVIVLHRTGELKFCDKFRFPANKCEKLL